MSNQIGGFTKGIILGGIIGAVIGILYAPKSGRETRDGVNRKAEELLQKAKEEYEEGLKRGSKAYAAAVKELKTLKASTKETVGEMEEKVEEFAELGKEALQDTKGRLTKVVDAAVQAFK